MTKFEFQTGDKVLARYDDEGKWEFHHFSHVDEENYVCGGWSYKQCIPYNETMKHLCGTSNPYIDPAEAPAFEFGDVVEYEWNNIIKTGIFCFYLLHEKRFARVACRTREFDSPPTSSLRLIRKGNFND